MLVGNVIILSAPAFATGGILEIITDTLINIVSAADDPKASVTFNSIAKFPCTEAEKTGRLVLEDESAPAALFNMRQL